MNKHRYYIHKTSYHSKTTYSISYEQCSYLKYLIAKLRGKTVKKEPFGRISLSVISPILYLLGNKCPNCNSTLIDHRGRTSCPKCDLY